MFDNDGDSVNSMLADIAVQSTGINKNVFIQEIGRHIGRTVAVWKYATTRMYKCYLWLIQIY